MSWLKWSPLALVLFAAVFFAYMLIDDTDHSILPAALAGEKAPSLQLAHLGDETTTNSLLDVHQGPYLLNIWGTWCVSCRAEHAQLVELAEQGVAIVGLNYRDKTPAALEWLEQLGDPYVVNLSDPNGDMGLELGVTGAPETYFIDAEGVIRHRLVGVLTETKWSEELEEIYSAL